MADQSLAARIAAAIHSGNSPRIQVRNVHTPDLLLKHLVSSMDETRILVFDGKSKYPVRRCLLEYFTGRDTCFQEKAFEAGWRSHLTEISLVRQQGMEYAAGLHSAKQPLKDFLCEPNGTRQADMQHIRTILSSFSMTLPTVFCIMNGGADEPFSRGEEPFPAIVSLETDGSWLSSPDTVIDSGMMPRRAISKLLIESCSTLSVEDVLEATQGRAGLVQLYIGIQTAYPDLRGTPLDSLQSVFIEDPDFYSFCRAASILAPGFLPPEVAILSGTQGENEFKKGRDIGLWNGHLVASFLSAEVQESVSHSISDQDKKCMYESAAGIVLDFRGRSAVSLAFAGSLLARGGYLNRAGEMYFQAAGEAKSQWRKAGFYRTASLLNSDISDMSRFQAALCYYRENLTLEAMDILSGDFSHHPPGFNSLKALCSLEASNLPTDGSSSEVNLPELSGVILRARKLHSAGRHHEAESFLARSAVEDESLRLVALIEMGDLLLRRGYTEASRNVLKSVTSAVLSEEHGWLETKALFTLLKTQNRTGRLSEAAATLERLLEIVPGSGNKLQQVSLYNLYANFLILNLDYRMALKVYRASIRTLGETDRKLKAVILNNMSIAQRKLMRTDDALGSLMRLVRETVSAGDLAKATVAYGNLARYFIDLSRFDSAQDCLETMLEFNQLSGGVPIEDSICYISSQIFFFRGRYEEAINLMDTAISISRASGNKRKLSLYLVKKGSMQLRLLSHEAAADTLREAVTVSQGSKSKLNTFVARMKLTAAECYIGESEPWELLDVPITGSPELCHFGEQYFHHWKNTASSQSLTAAAQLLSRGLLTGFHLHSYLHMLEEIANELPPTLADALPLVHNYPSCDSMKGD